MIQYSQRDKRWATVPLGFGNTSIGSHGCKLTSFAMLDGRTPLELNQFFKEEGAFSGDLLIDERCAAALGWALLPRTTTEPSTLPCIAEVDMSPAPGKRQHFVVWQDGGIIDPWDGTTRGHGRYPEVSFRNFVIPKVEDPMKKELVAAIEDITKKRYGENLNEKEQEDAAKKLEEVSETISRLKKSETELSNLITETRKRESKLSEDIAKCEAKLSQSQATETSDSIDTYSLGALAGAFFRKLIQIKK